MSRTFSVSIKALALFLAILTVAYLLPMTVFGEMIAENGFESVVSNETGAVGMAEVVVLEVYAEGFFDLL